MSPSQIIIYGVLVLLILFYLRRWWMTRSISRYSPQQASDRVKQGGAILLDVRTNAERSANHVKGSLHIPLNELARRSDEITRHKNKEIICYCQSGNRSLVAAAQLKKRGFQVADMTGGLAEWNYSQLT